MSFLGLGGTVGAGLFLGVGIGLKIAGTGLLGLFVATGIVALRVTLALTDLALSRGNRSTFIGTTAWQLGPKVAFIEGWGYWLAAVLACMAQLTAAGTFLSYLLPAPAWFTSLTILIALFLVNRLQVGQFGEIEFFLAALKTAVLGATIIGALVYVGLISWAGGTQNVLAGLVKPLPLGVTGLIGALPVALFSFGNVELVGLANPDLADAKSSLRAAVVRLIAALIVLYVGVAAALLVLPASPSGVTDPSPFVVILQVAHIPAASQVMAAILVIVMVSSCNSCLYGASRALDALAVEGCAPSPLRHRDANGAPSKALLLTLVAVTSAIVMEYLIPDSTFQLLFAAAAFFGLLNWCFILISHWRMRRGSLRAQVLDGLALVAILAAFLAIALQPQFAFASLVAGLVIVVLGICSNSLNFFKSADQEKAAVPSPLRNP